MTLRNKVRAILDADLDTTTTTVLVNDGSVFPSSAFYIMIDGEIMLCTTRSSNSLTVVRGQDGTNAIAHEGGALVGMPVSSASFEKVCSYAGGPCPSLQTAPQHMTVSASDFTWVNQGTSTVTDNTWGGICLKAQSNSPHSLRMLLKSYTAPLTVTLALQSAARESGVAGSHWGIALRESATGKIRTLSQRYNGGWYSWTWNTETNFASQLAVTDLYSQEGPFWFQMEDDNTDLYFRVSFDGVHFFELYTVARTTFYTTAPDQVGWYLSNHQVDGLPVTLTAWYEE